MCPSGEARYSALSSKKPDWNRGPPGLPHTNRGHKVCLASPVPDTVTPPPSLAGHSHTPIIPLGDGGSWSACFLECWDPGEDNSPSIQARFHPETPTDVPGMARSCIWLLPAFHVLPDGFSAMEGVSMLLRCPGEAHRGGEGWGVHREPVAAKSHSPWAGVPSHCPPSAPVQGLPASPFLASGSSRKLTTQPQWPGGQHVL